MSDEPFTAPNQKLRKRQPRPGEVLWALTKGAEHYRAELRLHAEFGVELQLFLADGRGDHFVYGQRYPIRAMAVSEANRLFEVYSDRARPKARRDLDAAVMNRESDGSVTLTC